MARNAGWKPHMTRIMRKPLLRTIVIMITTMDMAPMTNTMTMRTTTGWDRTINRMNRPGW